MKRKIKNIINNVFIKNKKRKKTAFRGGFKRGLVPFPLNKLGKVWENQDIINIINDFANINIIVGKKCRIYNKYSKNIININCDCCFRELKKRNKKIMS